MARGQVQKNGPLRRQGGVAALLLLYLLLALTSLWNKSVTVDEYAHLPAACAVLQHGTLDLYGKNPPLVRYLLGAPAMAAGAVVPVPRLPTLGAGWDPWRYGDTFVAANAGPTGLGRYRTLLRAARVAGVVLGALLLLLVHGWGRRIHGPAGGLAAAFLLALSPAFLAHARLSTLDVGASLAITAALFLIWRALLGGGLAAWGLAGAGVGAAVAAKFTALLLLPVLVVVLLVSRRWRAGERQPSLSARAGWLSGFLAAAWLVLLVAYQFQDPLARVDSFRFHSRAAQGLSSWLPDWAPVPLPAALVRGMDAQLLDLQDAEMPNYLNGDWSRRGWWYYYPETLLLKTPLALWGMLLLGALLALQRRRRGHARMPEGKRERSLAYLVLGAWAVALLLSSLASHLDIGVRYLLPAFPAAYLLLCGLVTPVLQAGRWWRVAALGLALTYGAATLGAHPHYLPFFNTLAGGPAGGWRYLANSNNDWGQDLPLLKRWLEQQGLSGQRIHLAYFGHLDPRRYGIDFVLPPDRPQPGVHVVSLNFLLGLPYVAVENGRWVLVGPNLVQPQEDFAWLRRRMGTEVARLGESLWIFRVGEPARP
jgi:4-amino-4-deoxy-L-arabinose transferase-like glycosyltransferase